MKNYPVALDDWRFRFLNLDLYAKCYLIIMTEEIFNILNKMKMQEKEKPEVATISEEDYEDYD